MTEDHTSNKRIKLDEKLELIRRLDEEDDIEQQHSNTNKRSDNGDVVNNDLYLDTINRNLLDFDFEKVCSVTLDNKLIYCCLRCGKYFKGRSKSSPAYNHSIVEDHHVYLNLETEEFFVLPEGYKVKDNSLNDIINNLNPRWNVSRIEEIDKGLVSYDINKQDYLVGIIGLNDLNDNNYINVVLQSLLHLKLFRNHFLLKNVENKNDGDQLINSIESLVKKYWNKHLFKSQLNPHLFIKNLNKKFHEPLKLLTYILNYVKINENSKLIDRNFKGKIKISKQKVHQLDESEEIGGKFKKDEKIEENLIPFVTLTCELPIKPIFKSLNEQNIIPQVSLFEVLKKFDGETVKEVNGELTQYKLMKLPKYLIINFKRFDVNNFTKDYNPTIVNFPINGVDFKEYIKGETDKNTSTVYDLIVNISKSDDKYNDNDDNTSIKWKCQLKSPFTDNTTKNSKWFEIQDLFVNEIDKRLIPLSESYIQVSIHKKLKFSIFKHTVLFLDLGTT